MKIEDIDVPGCKMISDFIVTGIPSSSHNTVILSSVVQPPSYPYINYIPFIGTDMSAGINLGYSSSSGCDAVCLNTVGCIGYVTSWNDCYLRAVTTHPNTNNNATSFYQIKPVRKYTVYNYIDYVIPHMITYNGDRRECRQACDALPGCVGYVISHTFIELNIDRG